MAYSSGISNNAGVGAGIGMGAGGNMGLAYGTTAAISQSSISQRLSPPDRSYVFVQLLIFTPILGLVGGYFVTQTVTDGRANWMIAATVLAVVGLSVLFFKLDRVIAKEYEEKRAQWRSFYICFRCGNIFRPELPSPSNQEIISSSCAVDSSKVTYI